MNEKNMVTAERLADLVLRCFGAIPTRLRKTLFTGCFALLYHLLPRRQLLALHNLRRAFPEKSSAEIVRIAKGVYRNMGIVAAEFFDIPRLTRENIGEIVEAEGLEHCTRGPRKGAGRPVSSGPTSATGSWRPRRHASARQTASS